MSELAAPQPPVDATNLINVTPPTLHVQLARLFSASRVGRRVEGKSAPTGAPSQPLPSAASGKRALSFGGFAERERKRSAKTVQLQEAEAWCTEHD